MGVLRCVPDSVVNSFGGGATSVPQLHLRHALRRGLNWSRAKRLDDVELASQPHRLGANDCCRQLSKFAMAPASRFLRLMRSGHVDAMIVEKRTFRVFERAQVLKKSAWQTSRMRVMSEMWPLRKQKTQMTLLKSGLIGVTNTNAPSEKNAGQRLHREISPFSAATHFDPQGQRAIPSVDFLWVFTIGNACDRSLND